MPFVEGKLYKVIYPSKDGLIRFNDVNLKEVIVCRENVFMFLHETQNEIHDIFYCISEKAIVSIGSDWSKVNMKEVK